VVSTGTKTIQYDIPNNLEGIFLNVIIIMRITSPLTFCPYIPFEFKHYERHQREDEYPREDRHESKVHGRMLEAQALGGQRPQTFCGHRQRHVDANAAQQVVDTFSRPHKS